MNLVAYLNLSSNRLCTQENVKLLGFYFIIFVISNESYIYKYCTLTQKEG